jgi:hypothetical protein
LEEHKISFFVDDRRDIAEAIDDEMQRRSGTVPLEEDYIGPNVLCLVPTVHEGGRVDSLEPYRRLLAQRPHGRLQLVPNLSMVVDRMLVYLRIDAEWSAGPR